MLKLNDSFSTIGTRLFKKVHVVSIQNSVKSNSVMVNDLIKFHSQTNPVL